MNYKGLFLATQALFITAIIIDVGPLATFFVLSLSFLSGFLWWRDDRRRMRQRHTAERQLSDWKHDLE